jgi:hypothetical protein
VIFDVQGPSNAAGLTLDAAGNIFGIEGKSPISLAAYEQSPDGAGGWNSNVIHTLAGKFNEAFGAPAFDSAGNLYGTIIHGLHGEAYKLSPVTKGEKKGKWTEGMLHSFSDPSSPIGGLCSTRLGIFTAQLKVPEMELFTSW